ncbi:MAG: hypothetical protein AABX00_05465 [Nanoarchaeota archaeon]
MNKKCMKCNVPLEGFLYGLIAKPIFGVKPSKKNRDLCNKCENKEK